MIARPTGPCARRLMLTIVGLAALASLSGCEVLGVLAGKVAGEPEVPAQYEPDKTLPLLVIAENYREPSASRTDADRLARFVTTALSEAQVAPMVEPDRLAVIRDAHPRDFDSMSVATVAREAGARQVIYIDLTAFAVGVQPGSDWMKGVASARVSVIDVEAGRTVFPGQSEGVIVNYESPMRRLGDNATLESVRSETLIGIGQRIARMFHKWKPDEVEPDTSF